jgi:hypothetical protein
MTGTSSAGDGGKRVPAGTRCGNPESFVAALTTELTAFGT